MRAAVREELLRINRAFYQSRARSFAETRRRPQPGILRVLAHVDRAASVLDLGCGHGLVAEELGRRGFQGRYRGLDSSETLLEVAHQRVASSWASFSVADLTQSAWRLAADGACDWLLAFAVLHHIPDATLRLRVIGEMRSVLSSIGRVAVSAWDFAGSERLRKRIVPWKEAGLNEADVEPGDALLDWRHGGRALRYVHHFSPEELAQLACEAGLTVLEEFHSDGQGGRLGLYQIWGA